MWVSVNSRPVLLYLSFSHIKEVNFRGFQYYAISIDGRRRKVDLVPIIVSTVILRCKSEKKYPYLRSEECSHIRKIKFITFLKDSKSRKQFMVFSIL